MKCVSQGHNELLTHNLEQLSSHFRPRVENCARGRVKVRYSPLIGQLSEYSLLIGQGHFPGVLIDKTELGGRSLTSEFPFVSRVRTWRRHVELEHGASPVLSLR